MITMDTALSFKSFQMKGHLFSWKDTPAQAPPRDVGLKPTLFTAHQPSHYG